MAFNFLYCVLAKSLTFNSGNELNYWIFLICLHFCIAIELTSHGQGLQSPASKLRTESQQKKPVLFQNAYNLAQEKRQQMAVGR